MGEECDPGNDVDEELNEKEPNDDEEYDSGHHSEEELNDNEESYLEPTVKVEYDSDDNQGDESNENDDSSHDSSQNESDFSLSKVSFDAGADLLRQLKESKKQNDVG